MVGQALWMDLALARHSGQELHNDYVLTTSPAFGNLRKFFRAAVSKCQVSVAIFVGIKMAAGVFTTGHFELKYFEINEIISV